MEGGLMNETAVMLSMNDLATVCEGSWNVPEQSLWVERFCLDSRQLRSGDFFVALSTSQRDGHQFVAQAKAAGAVAALVMRYLPECDFPQLKVADTRLALQGLAREWRQRFSGAVIGVTGSCGKTTVKNLLACLLGESTTYVTEKNLNNTLGVPLNLMSLREGIHKTAVIEAGISEFGEMETLVDMIDPDWVIVTNIGDSHLEGLGSRAGVAEAKSVLAYGGRRGAQVVMPRDCYQYPPLAALGERAYWVQPGVRGSDERPIIFFHAVKAKTTTTAGYSLQLFLDGLEGYSSPWVLPAMSEGMVESFVLAIVLSCLLGRSHQEIQHGLDVWRPDWGRGQWLDLPQQCCYFDAYNANPDSLLNAWSFFAEATAEQKNRVFIVGSIAELGEESPLLHRELGERLPWRWDDEVWLLGEESRFLQEGLLRQGAPEGCVRIFSSKHSMAEAFAQAEGVFFIKGSRCHRLEDILPEFWEDYA